MTDKINVITLGCSKNKVDSEFLIKQLIASGIDVLHDSNDASEVVIINTCGFIAAAKQESIDTILQAVKMKQHGKIKKIIVFGCLSERYAKELKEEIPEVDVWLGVNNMSAIVQETKATFNNELLNDRVLTTPSHYAYLKIAEGCNRHCSFCAIPLIRGKHHSKSKETLLNEATRLVAQGVKELLLISQDLTYYGIDLYGTQQLTSLVHDLSDKSGAEWIRLHYLFPLSFPMELLTLMQQQNNICQYIDIPLQHINNRILKSMKRGSGKKEILKLIDKMKELLPNATLRTTFIVGYPQETEKEFMELIDFVQTTKFDRVGVFTYSAEEQTAAFLEKDNISERVKQQRAEYLMSIQQDISLEKNQKKVGTTQKILIDSFENPYYLGRSEADSPEVDNTILIKSATSLEIGNFYNIKIMSADIYEMTGIPEKDL